ncbi:hypothetical protein KEM60_01298 [Austwickia sp. TVS 96-490-7B]|uniref:hypothetical protein n=1 Tax=Austwickia sp. TVS 96-490-7B TaxID=2830843 RepID=UPI001C58408D|nr:hypothetical protein [Austwickia sp. TVS 96-490-7B]MBW3085105.1 hypothetical protein [Austwickia sp. TVS 96-490-7B]
MDDIRHTDSTSIDLDLPCARDELLHALALSGSVQWGITSGQLLRPLSTGRPNGRATRTPRSA